MLKKFEKFNLLDIFKGKDKNMEIIDPDGEKYWNNKKLYCEYCHKEIQKKEDTKLVVIDGLPFHNNMSCIINWTNTNKKKFKNLIPIPYKEALKFLKKNI